ncbi:MAG: YraN family protein [Oscillospiraceae bacterium]|nr:YraN family protein [Oscillospiraceae bacterium]
MTAAQRGKAGEELAADFLQEKGYRIIARNFHCRGGELDIVAAKDEILAFVEVRTRKKGGMVSPVESVTAAKRKKVIAAAYAFLEEHSEWQQTMQPRFDLFLIEADGDAPEDWQTDYLCDAFQL